MILFDIDHFKRINDSWGHDQGDTVLRQVANSARTVMRGRDRIGRIGGEEFLVVLPGASVEQAAQAAERLRLAISQAIFKTEPAAGQAEVIVPVTISLGVSSQRDEDRAFDRIVARADAALYRAKAEGRNRVVAEQLPTYSAAASV